MALAFVVLHQITNVSIHRMHTRHDLLHNISTSFSLPFCFGFYASFVVYCLSMYLCFSLSILPLSLMSFVDSSSNGPLKESASYTLFLSVVCNSNLVSLSLSLSFCDQHQRERKRGNLSFYSLNINKMNNTHTHTHTHKSSHVSI